MARMSVVFVIVASVAAICPAISGETAKWYAATIDLYTKHENRWVGALKLHQPDTSDTAEALSVTGQMWGLPAGKYFAVLHENSGHESKYICNTTAPMIQTYDDRLMMDRPLILFWDHLEKEKYRVLRNFVGSISLNPNDKDYRKNFLVVVYSAPWDESGPLNSFFQPGATTPVACGVSYHAD